MNYQNFIVFGASGNIGSKVIALLTKMAHRRQMTACRIYAVDQNIEERIEAGEWVYFQFRKHSVESALADDYLKSVAKGAIVINAMPHFTSKAVVDWAVENGANYFDFTEDVGVRAHIKDLDDVAKAKGLILAPGQGLAPGLINIIGASALKDAIDAGWTGLSLKMRVGALSYFVDNDVIYNFTWSPDGVVNEYLNSEVVLENGGHVTKPGMSDYELLTLNGQRYEAFITSGGLGTLLDDFFEVDAKVLKNINYKTIRDVGHWRSMDFLIKGVNGDRKELQEILLENVPFATEDYVVTYVSVTGRSPEGRLKMKTRYDRYDGDAIRRTTAAGLLAVVEFMLDNPQIGFLSHASIPFSPFMARFDTLVQKT